MEGEGGGGCRGELALALSEGLNPPLKSWEVRLKYELVESSSYRDSTVV